MVLRRSDFAIPKESREVQKVAKLLASRYSLLVRSENTHRHPLNSRIPLEASSVFIHFVKTAKLVLEEKADPEVYLKSQFLWFKRLRAFPFPAQLHTPNARLRYLELSMRIQARKDMEVVSTDGQIEGDDLERRRLIRVAKTMGLKPRAALKQCSGMFSTGFRQRYLAGEVR